jgi:simple sugar transport system permease protein
MFKKPRFKTKIAISYSKNLTFVVVLILVFIVLTIVQPRKFLGYTNLQQMAFQIPEFGVLALAMMVAMLSGGIDLSIISITNLAGIIAAIVLLSLSYPESLDLSMLLKGIMAEEAATTKLALVAPTGIKMFGIIIATIVVAVGIAGICGLFNGVLVSMVRIPPILATLGTMKLYEGISLVITKGSPITNFPKSFLVIGSGTVSFIPVPMIIFIVCVFVVSIFLNRTRLGYSIYAVGENSIAARFSGLKNKNILIKTYLVTGLLSGIATILMISRVDSVKVGYGSSFLLQSVLVVILGGVSYLGGSGNVAGVVLGIFILRAISSGFNIIGFSNHFRNVIWGLMLVLVTIVNFIVPKIAERIKYRVDETDQRNSA